MASHPSIVYTRHAKGRMRWRHISCVEVEAVLHEPDRIEQRNGKCEYWKSVAGRSLRVIAAQEGETLVVITAMERE